MHKTLKKQIYTTISNSFVKLHMYHKFLYIPYSTLKFNSANKPVTQSKINSQHFLSVDDNIFKLFCKALHIIYKFLWMSHIKLKLYL